jgi:hypothetical protein
VGQWVTVGASPTDLPGQSEADEADAWALLRSLPPSKSSELAVMATYGEIAWWRGERAYTGADPGFGIRGAYGKHFGEVRLGGQLGAALEGPMPIYWSAVLEPLATVDVVKQGILVGASLGPGLMLHGALNEDFAVSVSPTLALRAGVSQPWSRVARRMFVGVEPRVRLIRGEPALSVAIVVGQGRGQ